MKIIKKEYVKYLEWAFKLSYLLLGIATFNSFLYDSPVQPMLVQLCLVSGVMTILGRIVWWKDYIKTPFLGILVVFCISFLISIVANWKYGAGISDIKWLIWTAFLFLILYTCDSKRHTSSYKKEFHFFAHVIILYSGVSAIISLYMMQTLYHVKWFTTSGELMLAGFHWGRLWGVYTDPNYGGVLSTIAVLLCLYYCTIKKRWKKIPYALILGVDYVYILFSDSRTAELSLAAALVFWIIFSAFLGKWGKKKSILGTLLTVITVGIFILGGSYVKTEYSEKIDAQIKIIDAKKVQQSVPVQSGKKLQKTERTANLEQDVTNGRVALWKSGIEIWKSRPLTGTGYNSFLPYVRENLPKTYVINNNQGQYVSLHNEYLNIMVYQGIFGIAAFLAFGILVLCKWGKTVLKSTQLDDQYIGVLSASVLVVAIAMIFLMEGLYTNSPAAFVLWTFLGYLMQYTQNKE